MEGAQQYRLHVKRYFETFLDQTIGPEICTALLCDFDTSTVLEDWRWTNGPYTWYVAALVDGTWIWSSAAGLTVNVPLPTAPSHITVEPQGASTRVSWDEDLNARWVRIWIGAFGTKVYNGWLEYYGSNRSYTCESGRCTTELALNLEPNRYDLYMTQWGPGGFSFWNGLTFTVSPPDPIAPPTNITFTRPGHYPVIAWDDNGEHKEVRIWIGNTITLAKHYAGWHTKDGTGVSYTCDGSRCVAEVHIALQANPYVVWMQAKGDISLSNWVQGPELHIPPTSPPVNIAVAVTGNSATISWDDNDQLWVLIWIGELTVPPQPAYHKGWYERNGAGNRFMCADGRCTAVINIQQPDLYQLWMRAWDTSGMSDWRQGPNIKIEAVPAIQPPANINVSHGVRLPLVSWDANPDHTQMRIWIGKLSPIYDQIHTLNAIEPGYTCINGRCTAEPNTLVPADTWSVWLQASGPKGKSNWVQAPDLVVPQLPPPTNLSVTGLNTPNPTFTWTGVPNTGSYYIYVAKAGSVGDIQWMSLGSVLVSQLSADCVNLTGPCEYQANSNALQAGEYVFTVVAFGTAGYGIPADATPFTYTYPYDVYPPL